MSGGYSEISSEAIWTPLLAFKDAARELICSHLIHNCSLLTHSEEAFSTGWGVEISNIQPVVVWPLARGLHFKIGSGRSARQKKEDVMIIFYKIVDKNKRYFGQENAFWIGNFSTKWIREAVLLKLDNSDALYVSDIPLKAGEKIFRYKTDRMLTQTPLIKINVVKGLIYFLKPEAEIPDFETKGVKAKYLILKEGWSNNGY